MIPRRQLPVHSPVRVQALAAGLGALFAPARGDAARMALASLLEQRYHATRAILTDSGTSALVLAVRAVARPGGIVAMPAYGCIDLTAAAVRGGVRVRLYDLDPHTLGPDLDSVERVMRTGVEALLVVHPYGMALDMVAVRALTAAAGVPIIEDAAQAAGGTLHGQPLGSFGDCTVLSFGRGKGTTGGGGGALLVRGDRLRLRELAGGSALRARWRGGREILSLAAQWALGRPSLYALPSALPWLQLGEMVYHPAAEPRGISQVSAVVARGAIEGAAAEVASRRARAARFRDALADVRDVTLADPITGSEPGYLRLPLRGDAARHVSPHLGILRAYPQTLREHAPLASLLVDGRESLAGASELARSLLTVPTHSRVGGADEQAIVQWLTGGRGMRAGDAAVTRSTFLDEHVTAL